MQRVCPTSGAQSCPPAGAIREFPRRRVHLHDWVRSRVFEGKISRFQCICFRPRGFECNPGNLYPRGRGSAYQSTSRPRSGRTGSLHSASCSTRTCSSAVALPSLAWPCPGCPCSCTVHSTCRHVAHVSCSCTVHGTCRHGGRGVSKSWQSPVTLLPVTAPASGFPTAHASHPDFTLCVSGYVNTSMTRKRRLPLEGWEAKTVQMSHDLWRPCPFGRPHEVQMDRVFTPLEAVCLWKAFLQRGKGASLSPGT